MQPCTTYGKRPAFRGIEDHMKANNHALYKVYAFYERPPGSQITSTKMTDVSTYLNRLKERDELRPLID